MYCLWPLLFVCPTIVFVCIVYTTPVTLVNCTLPAPYSYMSYNSVSVYYFYYYILKLYLPPPTGEESPWTTASHWRQKQTNIFFSSFHIYSSLCLLLQLALREGHMYCLWQLSCLLLVCTTLVCVLLLATLMSSISVYYFSMCTVCGHSHVYY